MELSLQTSTLQIASFNKTREPRFRYCDAIQTSKIFKQSGRVLRVRSSALPETAISIGVTALVVGVATNLLIKRIKSSESIKEVSFKTCEDCDGSGICPDCKGEGFVLKKISEQSAEKARQNSKMAATRYTAGLPKKWSYCTRCSSARSCTSCGGSGKLSY